MYIGKGLVSDLQVCVSVSQDLEPTRGNFVGSCSLPFSEFLKGKYWEGRWLQFTAGSLKFILKEMLKH